MGLRKSRQSHIGTQARRRRTQVAGGDTSTAFGRFSIENRRYIGSKVRLLDEIFASIPKRYRGGHFIDIFGGTGVVTSRAISLFKSVTINDHLYSNQVVYRGFFGRGRFSQTRLTELTAALRRLRLPEDSYFADEFGDRYFSMHDALRIASIREKLDQWKPDLSEREFAILLASLIYSVDRAARTVGHYETFLKSSSLRTDFHFDLISPLRTSPVKIYRADANALARRVCGDVAYVDPPYNSRQYSRFYHVLETLTKWDRPQLEGVARKPPTENSSLYCKTSAPETFADLIANIDARLIVVSYNNTYNSRSNSSRNKIRLEQIDQILRRRGKVSRRSIQVNHFNAGRSNLPDHREYIFSCMTS